MSSNKRKKTPASSSKTPCAAPRPARKKVKITTAATTTTRSRNNSGSNIDVKPRKSLLSMVLKSVKPDDEREQELQQGIHANRQRRQHEQKNPLELLPDEVLGKCFFSGFVDSIDIIKNVSMVSKRTRSVANKSVKMLDLRALPKLEAHDVATIVARHGHVSSLDFGYSPQFGREHLMALVPLSETLRTLSLKGTNVRDDDVVAYLDAVQVHLGERPSGLEEFDLGAIKREETSRIGDAAVIKISQCCPQLKSLQLCWCKGVTDECLPTLKNLRRLRTLDLSLTSITDEGCADLTSLHEVEKLDLSATGLSDDGIRNLVGVKSSSRPAHFKELTLRFNSHMTVESVSLLAKRMPSLKSLDVRHCDLDKNDTKDASRQLKRNGTVLIDE